MARASRMRVLTPKGVEVKLVGSIVHVKGPKGQLSKELPQGIVITAIEGGYEIDFVNVKDKSRLIGLARSLVQGMCVGVTVGFERKLEMHGVGYRAAIAGKSLDIQAGFSHPTLIDIPDSLAVTVDKGTIIVIRGSDKQVVGQFAATVRAKKPPEPYKQKGIRYEGEYVRKKAGKAAKK